MFGPTSTNPQKTPLEIHRDAWGAMHKTEWLFPQNFDIVEGDKETSGPLSSEEYLNAFARERALFMFRCPLPYSFALLEKYKANVAMSAHLVQNGAVVPYSVFQISDKFHFITDWLWSEEQEKFVFSTTLFINNQLEYGRFIEENRSLECILGEQTHMGFGTHSNG